MLDPELRHPAFPVFALGLAAAVPQGDCMVGMRVVAAALGDRSKAMTVEGLLFGFCVGLGIIGLAWWLRAHYGL